MSEMIYGDGAIRRPGLYGSSIENTYAGVLSFMRRTYSRELNGVDVVVSGVPLDLSTTFRSGARLGPQAIRAASVQLAELKPYPWGFDPFDDLAVIDYGDCWFDAHNPLSIKPTIVEHARTILASGAKMLTLGATSTTSMPTIFSPPRLRTIFSACALDSPPGTGVPVPGAADGSRQSMSNVTYTGWSPITRVISAKTASGPWSCTHGASSTFTPMKSSFQVRMPTCTDLAGSISPSLMAL